jgi:1-deoxy-D-xylulose-5-phosphate synthase
MHELARRGVFDRGLMMRNVCLPDRYIEQASPDEMYADAGMTPGDIAALIRNAWAGRSKVVPFSVAG